MVVLAEGALVGLEATGHHGLWSVLSAPTLASYLMGCTAGARSRREARAAPGEWLARVQAARVERDAGPRASARTSTSQAPGLAGVGLAIDGVPVHVAVFPA